MGRQLQKSKPYISGGLVASNRFSSEPTATIFLLAKIIQKIIFFLFFTFNSQVTALHDEGDES